MPTAGLSGAGLRLFALVALAAILLGRALDAALPGSIAGIAALIASVDRVTAFLSQLVALLGSLLIMQLLLSLRRGAYLGATYWLTAFPTAVAASLIVAAMQNDLTPRLTLGLGVLSALITLSTAPYALSRATSRAAGLVMAFTGSAALVYVLSRVIAIDASERALGSLFDLSRNVATLGFVLDAAALIVALIWLAARSWQKLAATSILIACVAVFLSMLAQRGDRYDATLVQILLARSLGELIRYPAPFVAPLVRQALELALILLSPVLAVSRRHAAALEVAVALALVSRAATDIPAFALLQILAALLAVFGSLDAFGPGAPKAASR